MLQNRPQAREGAHLTPSFERRVITSNIGVGNTLDLTNEVFVDIIDDTLSLIEKTLMRRCGPMAGYTMVVNGYKAMGMFEPNTFTRDGIDILKALELMSPLEAIQKDIITYVGERVDADAKDGTTTTMLFITKLLKMMNKMRKVVLERNASIHELNSAARNVFTGISKKMEDRKYRYEDLLTDDERDDITVNRDLLCASRVAYMQALSSSGGNYELAEAMREVFLHSPPLTWSSMVYRSATKETDKIFSVETPEYQDRLSAIPVNSIMNEAMRTEYHAKDARVLMYCDALDDYNPDADRINVYMSEYPEDKSLVIIAPIMPASLINKAEVLNRTRTAKIALFQFTMTTVYQGNDIYYEMDIVNARSGIKYPLNSSFVYSDIPCDDSFTFVCGNLIYRNGVIEFYDFIKEGDICLHPFIRQDEEMTPYYADTLVGIDKGIESNMGSHGNNVRLLEIFMGMKDNLITLRRPYLRIGGTTHDHLAAIPVVRDVQGAIMASLRSGFLINGAGSLYGSVKDMEEYLGDVDGLEGDFYKCILSAITSIVKHIYSDDNDIPSLDRDEYFNVLNPDSEKASIVKYIEYMKDTYSEGAEGYHTYLSKNYPILTPYPIMDELFKRTQEIFPKYITTDTVIVIGGVVVEEN